MYGGVNTPGSALASLWGGEGRGSGGRWGLGETAQPPPRPPPLAEEGEGGQGNPLGDLWVGCCRPALGGAERGPPGEPAAHLGPGPPSLVGAAGEKGRQVGGQPPPRDQVMSTEGKGSGGTPARQLG